MDAKHRSPAVVVVVAVAVLGCGQASGGPSSSLGSTETAAPSTLLSTEPSDAVPSEAARAPQPPVEFTGRISCGPPVRGGQEATVNVGDEGMVLARSRGGVWRQSVAMSDPRLEGTVYHAFEADTYTMPGAEEGALVWAATRRLQNDEGAWEERGYGGSFSDGTAIGGEAIREVWIGEGAYEGLIAIMEGTPIEGTCDLEVRGLIFQGAPVPEPYIP